MSDRRRAAATSSIDEVDIEGAAECRGELAAAMLVVARSPPPPPPPRSSGVLRPDGVAAARLSGVFSAAARTALDCDDDEPLAVAVHARATRPSMQLCCLNASRWR